jgi:hypothetical protein
MSKDKHIICWTKQTQREATKQKKYNTNNTNQDYNALQKNVWWFGPWYWFNHSRDTIINSISLEKWSLGELQSCKELPCCTAGLWPTLSRSFLSFCMSNSRSLLILTFQKVKPILGTARSKVWFWGLSLVWIAGSNPAVGMYACQCVVRCRPPRRAHRSSRGDLRSVVCLSVIMKPR